MHNLYETDLLLGEDSTIQQKKWIGESNNSSLDSVKGIKPKISASVMFLCRHKMAWAGMPLN